MWRGIIALALFMAPVAAKAEWREASSPHFIVYADDTERDIRRFSDQLERYHNAMAVVTSAQNPPPSPSNRVTVFVVKSVREIQRLAGNQFVAGFYIPRAGGSVAFVPQIDGSTSQISQSMGILLHEYAHHFLISSSEFPIPRWLGEGSAEFFSGARFNSDGGLTLGMPMRDNYLQIAYALDVDVDELVDPELYEKNGQFGRDAFYGKSWALYHYLTFDPERRGQLASYIRSMASGKTSRAAAIEAFGDLDELNRDLDQYLRRTRVLTLVFRPDQLRTEPVAVRQLSAGEAAILPVKIRSRRGVDRNEADQLVVQAREIAARYPGDAAVLTALAEAEFDSGHDAEAIAAADAALALDPAQVNAYVQKGYALFRQAQDAEDKVAAYRAAVAPFVALNRIENDHPLPLLYYYLGVAGRGAEPPEQAILGLQRAVELAPFDLQLRMVLATQQIQRGELQRARANLVPIAYNPHSTGNETEPVRRVIERIDAGGDPTAEELMALLTPPADKNVEASGGGG